MAGNVNKVFLMGNLTRDLEMRSLPSGTQVGRFGIAVNERFKDRNDQWQERANFIDCEIFGRRAEVMAQYLSKGSPVFLEGKLRFDQWETQQGEKRSKLKVVVDDFQFVDAGGRSGSPQQPGGQGGQREPSHAASGGGPAYEPVGEDDIPF